MHGSVVNAGVLDDPITDLPVVGFVTAGSTLKLRLLRRTGRATVVVRAGWEWVAVEGPVRLLGPDDTADGFAMERLPRLLRDVFTAAGGTHEDWTVGGGGDVGDVVEAADLCPPLPRAQLVDAAADGEAPGASWARGRRYCPSRARRATRRGKFPAGRRRR